MRPNNPDLASNLPTTFVETLREYIINLFIMALIQYVISSHYQA